MDEKRLQEIFSDEAFVQSLFEMDTAQEVQAALNEKGVAFTLEEIEEIKKQLAAQSNVMDETELSAVAGGFSHTGVPTSWRWPPIVPGGAATEGMILY